MVLFEIVAYSPSHTPSFEFWTAAGVSVLAGVVFWASGRGRNHKARKVLEERLWRKLVRDCRALGHARRLFLVVASACCIAGMAFFMQKIFWFGGVTIGLVMFNMGAFEPAERVFVSIPAFAGYKGEMTLIGTWDGEQVSANEQRWLLVTNTIANVYGTHSSQLARRFSIMGEKYRCAGAIAWDAGEKSGAKEDFERSIDWYRKSLALYEEPQLFESGDCLEVYSNIAFCQLRLNRMDEAVATFRRARMLIPVSADHQNFSSSVGRLGLVAYDAGLDLDAGELFDMADYHRVTAEPYSENWLWIPLAGLSFVALAQLVRMCALTGLSLVWSRTLLLNREMNNGVSIEETCAETAFRDCDNLVTLELLRGNVQAAEKHSIQLLKVAQQNCK